MLLFKICFVHNIVTIFFFKSYIQECFFDSTSANDVALAKYISNNVKICAHFYSVLL